MTLCASCPVHENCSFLASARLAQIQWAETGRAVQFSVDHCSVYETAKKDNHVQVGQPVQLIYKGEWRYALVKAIEDRWVTYALDQREGEGQIEVMWHLDDDTDKVRPA